jgi:hypothetical protein
MPADRDIIHFIFKIINVELIYFWTKRAKKKTDLHQS